MWPFGKKGPSGFSSSSTAEDVTRGVDATGITAIVTGMTLFSPSLRLCLYLGFQQVLTFNRPLIVTVKEVRLLNLGNNRDEDEKGAFVLVFPC